MSRPDPRLSAWCQRHLGSPAVIQFFGLQRLSAVHGLRLADGREVALKVRGALPRQATATRVQAALWAAGLPCPRPLAGPHPLDPAPPPPGSGAGGGTGDAAGPAQGGTGEAAEAGGPGAGGDDPPGGLAVNAETWEGLGQPGLGPLGAREWGALLARTVAGAPPVHELGTLEPPGPWLHWAHDDPDRTWPPPASDRWDPHRVQDVMDPLVPAVARRARARLLRPDVAALRRVAGHGDFEAQNCRWVADGGEVGGQRLVVHDWDSLMAMPEAVLAGNSAMSFVSVDDCDISTLAQNDDFLAGYAQERGREWTASEWQVAHAAGAWVAAYNAAFEHLKDGPGPMTRGLHEQAEERLRRAGA